MAEAQHEEERSAVADFKTANSPGLVTAGGLCLVNQWIPLSEKESLGADGWRREDQSARSHVGQELGDESGLPTLLCGLALSGVAETIVVGGIAQESLSGKKGMG